MIDFKEKEQYDMTDLVRIMAILRQPDGCPWDKVQTHQSIRQNFIEETYEVVEAIDLQDEHLLCEELGDVLLQVVFHSQIEAEKGSFDFNQVCDGICKKLIYRHPHLFGGMEASDPTQALENWEKMKNAEKGRLTAAQRLDSVPASLPALMRAAKAQKRAEAFGFRPENKQNVFDSLTRQAATLDQAAPAEEAVGEMLMCAVAAARTLGVEPEQALYRATDRFCERVKTCEKQAQQAGRKLESLEPAQRAEYWERSSLCKQSSKGN